MDATANILGDKSQSILLVDDNGAHRRLIKRALKKAGIENNVLEAEGLNNAREVLFNGNLTAAQLAVAVIDLNLGDGRGTDLIAELRGNEQFVKLPIIVLSTSGLERDIQESLSVGANSYLRKADDLDTLAAEITKGIRSVLGS